MILRSARLRKQRSRVDAGLQGEVGRWKRRASLQSLARKRPLLQFLSLPKPRRPRILRRDGGGGGEPPTSGDEPLDLERPSGECPGGLGTWGTW